jgi:ubiquinone/menaquinone biosynthesis C-methylase UbiE
MIIPPWANCLIILGSHRLWKDEFIDMLNLSTAAKVNGKDLPRHLDVAGGTGDIAFRSIREIARCYAHILSSDIQVIEADEKNKQVVVCDINPEMLSVGKLRANEQLDSSLRSMVSCIYLYL